MLHKYLCRIVTNAYQIINDGIYFENELNKLKKHEMTGDNKLDKLMNFHQLLVDKAGRVSFDNIFNVFMIVSDLTLTSEKRNLLSDLFYKENIIKICEVFSDLLKRNIKYLLLFELIYNTISYKNSNQMFVFRKHYFYNELKIKNIKEALNSIRENSIIYTQKKPVYELEYLITNIKKIINDDNEKYKFEKMWIFGSYAKDNNDCYSDLDIMIKYNDENQIKSLINLKYKLETELKLPVDLVLVKDKLDEFDIGVLKHAIEIK